MKISQKALKMKPSATLAVAGKAKELKREGKPVISFGTGEPDFDTPKAAIDAAIEAMKRGETHYTISTGIPELKEEVIKYYKRRFGLDFTPKEVIISVGAKHALFTIMQTILDREDEVIIPTPAWVSYADHVKCADGTPVTVDFSKNDFLPDIDVIKEHITPKTVAIMVNTPNNPTGAVYPKELIKQLVELCLEKKIWLIFDEIYERLIYDGEHYNPLQLVPEAKECTILVNGVSKAFAMTGWRIGYALAKEEFISKMAVIQGHITTNACSIAQWAAVGALRGAEEDVIKMHAEFNKRRDFMYEKLSQMPYVKCKKPKGAFYVFLNIEEALGKAHDGKVLKDDVDFCTRLLESKYLAAVPGSAFFAPGHIRLSYANSMEEIDEGMKRLKEFLEELS